MKVPICWLNDYVEFEDSVEGLSDKLTFSGIEVEAVETIGVQVEDLVVGDIVEVQQHPDADRLFLCKVYDGVEEHAVVCGAPNVEKGAKGVFARVGTVFPDGTKLKKAKIRGQESFGMLCAEDEIGLSEDHTGIIKVTGDYPAGTPIEEIYGEPETVLDLEITPNRPDCLSMMGVAREVAALYGKELKVPSIKLDEQGPVVDTLTSVQVEDHQACTRYIARVIQGVKVAPSPAWMQKRLTLAGIRPINNLVDITNFVLLECGHPLHAFDKELLAEERIVVRRAHKGEKIAALDESEHELDEQTLVICDAEKPVAIGGIMGGIGSEIRNNTTNVLLESAHFAPSLIRETSKRLGLRSDSSYRFERGTAAKSARWASMRCTQLITELAGGVLAKGRVDVYPFKTKRKQIAISWKKLSSMMGFQVSPGEAVAIFESLEFEILRAELEGALLEVPAFRLDLERDVDLVEEFARMYGLEKIPAPAPRGQIVPGADDSSTRRKINCRNFLVGQGLNEIVNYSLTNDGLLDLFGKDDEGTRVVMPNPVSQDQSVLRPSLIPQVTEALGKNNARQEGTMGAFEMGKVFFRDRKHVPGEEERLSIGLMGPVGRSYLEIRDPVKAGDALLWIKGIWENLAAAMNVKKPSLKPIKLPIFEAGMGLEISGNGQELGVLGILKQTITREWRIPGPVAVLEVQTAGLLKLSEVIKPLTPVSAYPSVKRDIAMLVGPKVKHQDVLSVIQKAAPKVLEDVQIFDIYEEAVKGSSERKSFAYSLTYRSDKSTLTDEEANTFHQAVKDAVRNSLDVEIRD